MASRISWSARRGYQSGAVGIYGHDPGALERLRSVVFSPQFSNTRIMVYNGHLITATVGSLDFFEIFNGQVYIFEGGR